MHTMQTTISIIPEGFVDSIPPHQATPTGVIMIPIIAMTFIM